jgi:alpha-1,6-mannosyltransferase
MTSSARLQVVALSILGVLGSVAIVILGPGLAGGSVRWWIDPKLSIGGTEQEALLYVAMGALTVAWLALGWHARARVMSVQMLWVIGLVWTVPLFLVAPVFSRDVYSYLGQGTILHLGYNPYNDPPTILAHLSHLRVLNAIDPFWQNTTAPYGPLFLGVVAAIVSATGQHVVLGAEMIKLLGLVGLVLLAVFVPRLARAQGADPVRATWLVTLNPLLLFALVVPGHNDLLMVGILVAGVALAAERHPIWGIALCAIAAGIKLPALAGAAFIAVTWARTAPDVRAGIQRLAQAAVVVVIVFALVGLATGVGASWLTSTLFSAPGRVKLAITPSSGLACTFAALGNGCVKTGSTFVNLQTIFRVLIGAASLLAVLEMLRRARTPTLARWLGLALLVLAWGGPAAWPWYFIWGIALLAAAPGGLTYIWCAVVIVAGAFIVKPGGNVAVSLQSGPWVMACYALALLAGWYAWRRWGNRGTPKMPSVQASTAVSRSDTLGREHPAPDGQSALAKP